MPREQAAAMVDDPVDVLAVCAVYMVAAAAAGHQCRHDPHHDRARGLQQVLHSNHHPLCLCLCQIRPPLRRPRIRPQRPVQLVLRHRLRNLPQSLVGEHVADFHQQAAPNNTMEGARIPPGRNRMTIASAADPAGSIGSAYEH